MCGECVEGLFRVEFSLHAYIVFRFFGERWRPGRFIRLRSEFGTHMLREGWWRDLSGSQR
jgi:hypothetical protein